ncbi:MAG: hypothetical protein HYW63_03125 [Candidatus Levybacteria bacterium]|nr:hypothetical protein [Candidatus Levybacteria bacterium]
MANSSSRHEAFLGPIPFIPRVVNGPGLNEQSHTTEELDGPDPSFVAEIDRRFHADVRWSTATIAAKRDIPDPTDEQIGAIEVALSNRALETDIPVPYLEEGQP